ncbi:alpha/beta fold hydrolase [Nocardia abscessus]|uniref:alpha/beta fold hydrolase n=1 Tax=Nocardia abscessus TaxID=120957 RepID=UPI00245646F1|nr:alpha/beta hydrolase [Nocardia abscessus]
MAAIDRTPDPVELEHHFADLEEVRLHYVTAGSGDPLVLLHGWPTTWYEWHKVIPLLSQSYRVIAPDLRGLGDSSRPSSGYDKRTISEDVWQLLRGELGLESWFLVGHDWGAVVAYALTAAHRDAIRRLAIVDMFIPGDGLSLEDHGGARWHHGFHVEPGLAEQLISGREEIYLRWFYRNYAYRDDVFSDDDVAEFVRNYSDPESLHAGFEYYRAFTQDIADNETSRAEGKLKMPVLAVGGAHCMPEGYGVGEVVALSMRQMAEDVREVIIPECAHWVPEEQPNALAKHLLDFFGEELETEA